MRKQNLRLLVVITFCVLVSGVNSLGDDEGRVEKLTAGFSSPETATIAGTKYPGAVYRTDSNRVFKVKLGGKWDYFEADVGLDDDAAIDKNIRDIAIVIWLDDKQVQEYTIERFKKPTHIKCPLKGKIVMGFEIIYDISPPVLRWINPRLISGNPQEPNPEEKPEAKVYLCEKCNTEFKTADELARHKSARHATTTSSTDSELLSFDTRDLEDLAKKLKDEVDKDSDQFKVKPVQLAVASFELIPKSLSPENARKVREHLSTALIKTRTFKLVERGQLDKVLAELKLGLNDTIDSATAQKIGKLINARAVLIGSISDEKTHVVINVRLINTETGEATIAESVEVKKR